MCTPRTRRRQCSPPPRLIDDLIPEILIRISPDDPVSLARASLACKPWRSVLTDSGFLRRYRAFHRKPPMLGFLRTTFSGGVPYARFVPTSSFRPACPDRRGMFAITALHGRVLLGTNDPLDGLVVWDPVTDEQWAVPPLPAAPAPLSSRYNATVFCAAAGCDHLDCHGGPFAVAFVGSCAGMDHTIGCVYSSESGEWGVPAELIGATPTLAIGHRPGVLVGNKAYFTCGPGRWLGFIVEYDMARGKFSAFEVPQWHRNHPNNHINALTVTEDGTLGFACRFCTDLYLWYWEAGPNGAMAWKLRRNINLDDKMRTSRDGMSAGHVPCVIGFAQAAGLVFVRTQAGAVFSVELKSGRTRETSILGFMGYDPDPLLIPYLSFCTPDRAAGRSPSQGGGVVPVLR